MINIQIHTHGRENQSVIVIDDASRLAGYGQFPGDGKMVPAESGLPLASMNNIDDFMSRCALNFMDHDAQLASLK